MKIENKELSEADYLSLVTYVPGHVAGNAGHEDCSRAICCALGVIREQGVIISFNDDNVKVLYCRTRTVQATNPADLVWG